MKRKSAIAALIGIVLIVGASCGAIYVLSLRNGQTHVLPSGDIKASLAMQMIANGSFPNVTIVDVRTPDEYNIMHIEGAINIPYYNLTDFPTRLSPLTGSEDKEIVIYCLSGMRSRIAWLYLNSTGSYHRIYNVLGGINAWRAMNYSVWHSPSRVISVKEAWWMIVNGQGTNGTFPDLVILDVRDADDWARGHLPNATNIPYSDDNFLTNLRVLDEKKNSEIIVYCSGKGCMMSDHASEALTLRGFEMVYVLRDGYSGWGSAGYPIEH